jgi:hypothetical protein
MSDKNHYEGRAQREPEKDLPGREQRRKSLMNQFNKLEREYEALMDNIPKGGLSKKDDDRRRELQLMLRQLGSDLGQMEPDDKQFP